MYQFLKSKKAITNSIPVLLVLLMGVILFLSFFSIRNRLIKQNEENMLNILMDITKQENTLVNSKINDWYEFAEKIAEMVTDEKGLNHEMVIRTLGRINKSTDKYVFIVGLDGRGFGYQKKYTISDRDYFKDILKGKRTVTNILRSRHNGERSIIVSVPIYHGNKVIGGVALALKAKEVQVNLRNDTLKLLGETYIIHSDGSIIVGDKDYDLNYKFYNRNKNESIMDYKAFLTFQKHAKKEKVGIYAYERNNSLQYLCYNYNRSSDWIIITVVDKHNLDTYIHNQTKSIITFIYIILFCISFLFIIILTLYYTIIRLLRKNQNKLLIEKERLETITAQAEEIIFDYNLELSILYFSSNFRDEFGISPPKNLEGIYDMIMPEHIQRFKDNFVLLSNEGHRIEFEVKIQNSFINDFKWYLLSASIMMDKKGSHRILGKLQNIQEDKAKIKFLKNLAEIDLLTNFYNKSAVIKHIDTFLLTNVAYSEHAYFFIDLDNFKMVNDTYGHQEGDILLRKVADIIKEQFSSSDIYGRFGGDEFIVLMKNIDSKTKVQRVAKKLCNTFYEESQNKKYSYSASIGIALYPRDATNHDDLMKKADDALYHAKHLGKNRYQFFDEI